MPDQPRPLETDYIKFSYQRNAHHQRYVRYVEKYGLLCQECGGVGTWVEPINEDGSGPIEGCGFCEGTGLVTRWVRGEWLRWKRKEKANA